MVLYICIWWRQFLHGGHVFVWPCYSFLRASPIVVYKLKYERRVMVWENEFQIKWRRNGSMLSFERRRTLREGRQGQSRQGWKRWRTYSKDHYGKVERIFTWSSETTFVLVVVEVSNHTHPSPGTTWVVLHGKHLVSKVEKRQECIRLMSLFGTCESLGLRHG